MESYQYPVAFTDLSIILPVDWVYADRSITDDSLFCISWDISPSEFIDEYLFNNRYAFAIDTMTGSALIIEVSETDMEDYSEITKTEIEYYRAGLTDWLEDIGEEIISSNIAEFNIPYCTAMTRNDDQTYYYYETVINEKLITFMFIIDTDEWDPSYVQIYNDIVEKVNYGNLGD